MHHSMRLLPMRGEATAVGLVQLCIELHAIGALDDDALARVKNAIAGELAQHAPRSVTKSAFLSNVQSGLDKVFGACELVRRTPAAEVH